MCLLLLGLLASSTTMLLRTRRRASFALCAAASSSSTPSTTALSGTTHDRLKRLGLHYLEYPDDDYDHILGINDPNHEPSKLQMISAQRLRDVAESKQVVDVQGCGFDATFFISAEDLEKEIKAFDEKYGKPLNLKERLAATWPEMALAAEFKKASPSKGDINPGADAVEQCLQYSKVGAAVISVLTEYKHFKGTLTDLKNVRVATQAEAEAEAAAAQKASGSSRRTRPAILRKDFVLDRYQVLEARSHGADTLLLIVAILGIRQLQDLMAFSRSLGMEPLVEVHTQREMEIAIDCGAKVIGVNNRNLHTFQLDLETTGRAVQVVKSRGLSWAPAPPSGPASDVTIAALSGITSAEDVAGFRDAGAGCCLVGETLMKSADPSATMRDLLSGGRLDQRGQAQASSTAGASTRALVKTCGLTSASDATAALQAGASLLGVIFVPSSPRAASAQQAKEVVEAARRYGERSAPLRFPTELAAMRADRLTPKLWFSRAADLLRRTTLRKPLVVGVFQDATAEEINRLVGETGIDLVQLHGDEPPSLVDRIEAPVIKVLHLPPASSAPAPASSSTLRQQAEGFSGKAIALLLDSRVPGSKGGGTGAVFDWSQASALGLPVLLAGGLGADNAAAAASTAGVCGLDVSSGVETAPGVKDHALLSSFVRNARRG